MGLEQLVERIFRTITPGNNRVAGSTYITHIPATPAIGGTTEGVTLTPGTAMAVWGNYAVIATAKQVPHECWIEGIELRLAVATGAERIVGIELSTATGIGIIGDMEAVVGGWVNTASPGIGPLSMYIPLNPPIYVREPTAAETAAGATRINAACASTAIGNKVDVKLQLSHQK